jgi:uncharacterized protein (DUF2267 family)
MPLPKPNGTESEQEFVSRCMHEIGNEYDQKQALAICYSTYQQASAQANIENLNNEIKAKVHDFLKTGK